ncbi:MAG TPA: hypothetical protein VEA37_06570, partial [Flavobacterium sp.]|nr:hypothetical protein [Flavobacterium sp.]
MKVNLFQPQKLIWLITLIAGLLGCWVIYLEQGRIGDDSVLYLEVARLLALGEWKQGVSLYNWPLYPALIALSHLLTGLSLQYSALLLSLSFYMLAVFIFCRLILESGGNRVTVISGAILLLSCGYITRDILPVIMRDLGFWAFYLCSILFLLKFSRGNLFYHALLWQASAIIAMLFRVEGITYLLFLPFFI